MLTIENEGKRIYIFNKDSYEIDDKFKPYFYYEDERGEYISLFGKKLKKVILNDPKDVPKIRDDYPNHHEADIIYTTRYTIDKFDEIKKEKFRLFYLDIELDVENGFPDIEKTKCGINVIAIYDNITEKYYQFIVPPNNISKNHMEKGKKIIRYFYINESQMLKSFMIFIQKTNPNIFLAWNGDGFDYPYLLNRMKSIGISIEGLSPINKVYCFKDNWGRWKNRIKGRILFDLMWGYKTISQGGRESYSLDYISKYELGEGKEKYEGNLKDLYRNDFDKFLKYNLKDVELMVMLNEKLGILDYFDEVRRIAHCDFLDVYSQSRIHNALCLFMAKKCGIILPSIKTEKRTEDFKGSFCLEPEKGLHNNVAVMDLKSLYPNIIRTLNLSPETYMNEFEDGCINVDGKFYYKKDRKGFLPKIIEILLEKRRKKKEEMKKCEMDSIEYRALNMIQYSLKVIANSLYGVISNPYFRLYKGEISSTITYIGRRIIKYSIDYFEKKGMKVVYADTDSIFLKIDDRDVDECRKLVEEINESYDVFVKDFNIERHYFEMAFEKIYKTILFLGEEKAAKKRYAGWMIWKDGKEIDKIDVMGFETRRSDSPEIIRKWQKDLFEKILRKESRADIMNFIDNFKEKFYGLKEELGIPISLHSRGGKTTPIHLRAAKLSNERHDTDFNIGDKYKYIYVVPSFGKANGQNVIAFKDELWDGYMVDYDRMWERLVEKKVEKVFDILGWENNRNMSLFDFK